MTYVCDMEEIGILGSIEKTLDILGDKWWPQKANQTGTGQTSNFYVIHGRSVMNDNMLEVSLIGIGTVLRLERDAWSKVK